MPPVQRLVSRECISWSLSMVDLRGAMILNQLLSLVCIGVALATVPNIQWLWAIPPLLAGMGLGFYLPVDISEGLVLAAGFIIMGGVLICSNIWLGRLMAPATLLFGGFVGHTLASQPLSILEVAMLALPVIVAILGRTLYRDWFGIARRIGGSWLLAAGVMMLTLFFKPPDPALTAAHDSSSTMHDPSRPHIHEPDGSITYLPTGRAEQPITIPGKPNFIERKLGTQNEP